MTDSSDKPGSRGDLTSWSLIERVRASDQDAWDRLCELYTPLIDRWCRGAGLQDADVADIHQEVFLAVAGGISNLSREQPGATFRGWLCGITQHKLADHFRGKFAAARDVNAAVESLQQQQGPVFDSSQETIAQEKRLLYRRALELIQRDFQERTWQAFWKVVIDGRKPSEVADELQMSLNAVYLARARVLARLREEFIGVIEP